MAKDVKIDLKGTGKFEVSHGGKSGETEATYPVLDFPVGSGPQLIVFKLDPGPYRLSQNDPIWVSSTAKPKQPSTDAQIKDAVVFDNGKTLVVLNTNKKAGTLYYNLNMQGNDGKQLTLDPVITNGGDTKPYFMEVAVLLSAAVAGALLSVLFTRFVLKWR